jgi:hypothetical protein
MLDWHATTETTELATGKTFKLQFLHDADLPFHNTNKSKLSELSDTDYTLSNMFVILAMT